MMATTNNHRNNKRPSSDSSDQFDIVRRPRNEDNSTTKLNNSQALTKLMGFIGTREEAVLFCTDEFGRKMCKTIKQSTGTANKGGKFFTYVCSGCTRFRIEFRYTQKKGFPHGGG